MHYADPRQGEYEYGWRPRRGRRWREPEFEGPYEGYAEAGPYGGYGEAEQEFPFPPFGPRPWYGTYGWRYPHRPRWGDYEGEAPGVRGAGEQQFLQFLPLIGSVLSGLLKETEEEFSGEYAPREAGYGPGEYGPGEYEGAEYGPGESGYLPGEYGETEFGEAEQFLGGILKKILGGEAEQGGAVLSPARESELASRLMEISSEEELEGILGNVVSLVGRAVNGIRDFAASPAGHAVIEAVKPLARAALPAVGAAVGSAIAPGAGTAVGRALGTAASSLFEIGEAGEASGEQAAYEMAHRVVQLTSAAARTAALAPGEAPPQVVGEAAVWHEARHFAPGFYHRGLHRIGPLARVYHGLYGHRRWGGYGYGRRWGGYRGRHYGRSWGHYGGWHGHRWGHHGGYYGRPWSRWYGGYVPQPADSGPSADDMPPADAPPPPSRPGFRWVLVPDDAAGQPQPAPGAGGPPGTGGPGGPGGPGAGGPGGSGGPSSGQSEVNGWSQLAGRGYGYGA